MNEREERHEVFKELYRKAQLDRLEFNAAVEVFKDQNPDYITDDRFDPGINNFKKYIRGRMW